MAKASSSCLSCLTFLKLLADRNSLFSSQLFFPSDFSKLKISGKMFLKNKFRPQPDQSHLDMHYFSLCVNCAQQGMHCHAHGDHGQFMLGCIHMLARSVWWYTSI